jgi:Flp pilus assembly protein TadD
LGFEKASGWLLAAIGQDRREDRLWQLHGESELGRELVWNSIGSLREAHRLAPYDPEAAVRLGRSLVENKQFEEAEKVLSGVAAYAPNFYDLWEPLAACYYFQGKHAEAVKAYDWMIFFNVNTTNAFLNKSAAQGMAGHLPEALLTLKTAQQRFPEEGKIYLNLAITYIKLGMRVQAKEAWAKAAKLVPSDPQVDQIRKVLH